VRFLQFAFSSKVVTDASALRIQREKIEAQKKGYKYTPDFGGVGDAVFAMREFSSLLTMSGMQKSLETNIYSEDLSSPFAKALSPAELQQTRSQMYAAPSIYSEHSVTVNGQSYALSAKIHHKVVFIPDWFITVAGTSFNFSVNAESNNEQIAIFRNEKVMRIISGAYEWLKRNARGTVYDIAMKRNKNPRPPKVKESKDVEDPTSMGQSCEGLF
jgi:phosphatidylserine/phosphatidylglycerophosphate/cardiolipin synthase-like enzyme